MQTDGQPAFPQTRWTLLQAAAGTDGRAALDELIRLYWKPVYSYIRQRGIQRETAADLTQEYFAGFLERDLLAQFDAEKGRFKTFLLATLKHFLANEHRRAQAQKRGGGNVLPSADVDAIEPVLSRPQDPERAFHRQWAEDIMDQALGQLDPNEMRLVRASIGNSQRPDYGQLASELGVSESDVRNALRRLRRRLRGLVIAALREDAGTDGQDEALMQELFLLF